MECCESSANRFRGFLSLRNERSIRQGAANLLEVGPGFFDQFRLAVQVDVLAARAFAATIIPFSPMPLPVQATICQL
jgi:hypothetical protein